jgi:pyrimidine operon attenuation protein / uracil phosphoribosyltransferase
MPSDPTSAALANADVASLLSNLVEQIQAHCQAHQLEDVLLVGIHSGGAWLASELHKRLGWNTPVGFLNIGFYRDDYSRRSINLSEAASHLPAAIDERMVILVDDILYTGRTIRAALNELFDYGRPAAIHLACLIARDGRELPIEATFCALRISLPPHQVIKLRGPEPLSLELRARS